MDIYTLRDNLKLTIAGKAHYLKEFSAHSDSMPVVKSMMIQVMEGNLEELSLILADVEKCCQQATDASWKGSADRQGGSFDASEYDRERW